MLHWSIPRSESDCHRLDQIHDRLVIEGRNLQLRDMACTEVIAPTGNVVWTTWTGRDLLDRRKA